MAQLELELERNAGFKKICQSGRGERDRMRRMAPVLGLVATGLLGLPVVSVLAPWFLLMQELAQCHHYSGELAVVGTEATTPQQQG